MSCSIDKDMKPRYVVIMNGRKNAYLVRDVTKTQYGTVGLFGFDDLIPETFAKKCADGYCNILNGYIQGREENIRRFDEAVRRIGNVLEE